MDVLKFHKKMNIHIYIYILNIAKSCVLLQMCPWTIKFEPSSTWMVGPLNKEAVHMTFFALTLYHLNTAKGSDLIRPARG